MQRTHFRHVITGDESWFCLEYQHTPQYLVFRDEVLQRVDLAIGTTKFMLTAIWGVSGFHLLDLIPPQCIFNTQYFVKLGMAPLVQVVFPQRMTRYTPGLKVISTTAALTS
jgi:hypothetical protein